MGKGVTRHKRPWKKPFLFVKRVVRERGRGWHRAQCSSCHGAILELSWDGNAEMPLSVSCKPELTLGKGERERCWV